MRRVLLSLCVALAWASPVIAQHLGHGESGLAHGIPDFCDLTMDKIEVANGDTLTISGTTTTDVSCIGVHGTLNVGNNTTIRFDNLIIYEDGVLNIGSSGSPATGVLMMVRDECTLDLTLPSDDPEQFGCAVIGFGDINIHGNPALTGTTPRSIRFISETPATIRGHVIFTQRADVDIRYAEFTDLGRTKAEFALDSATFSGETATYIGTNQIGRYPMHLHHVIGLYPAEHDYQFYLIGNLFIRGEKWGGITLHNASFGLIQDNHCTLPSAVCYTEEDGSETENEWIDNYAGQSTGATGSCNLTVYDPEGRCSAGYWLRGTNQVLRGNVIEDMERGIGWWNLCLEVGVTHPCGNVLAHIPLFPGADTTDPEQIRDDCLGSDLSPGPCRIMHQEVGPVEDTVMRRVEVGFDPWWYARIHRGGAVITNSTFEDVLVPIGLHYSDMQFDGITATGCHTFVEQFNDGSILSVVATESYVKNATAVCSDWVFRRIGQLWQAPLWLWEDVNMTSAYGIRAMLGGERVVGYPHSYIQVTDSTFTGPIFEEVVSYEVDPSHIITITSTNVNGASTTKTSVDGEWPGDTDPPVAPPGRQRPRVRIRGLR